MQRLFAGSRRRSAKTLDPRAGAEFAGLRRCDLALADLRPMPIVIAVTGLAPTRAISTALLAEAFTTVIPRQVAVLDADGVGQSMRDALGSGSSGDVRQLARSLRPGSPRRAVDAWLDFEGAVPLCAADAAEPREVVDTADLVAALRQLARRFTAVLVHLPADSPAEQVRWVLSTADHIVFVCDQADLAAAAEWRRAVRPNTLHPLVVTGLGLAEGGPGRVGDLDLRATAAIADLLVRVTVGWRC